MIPAGRLRATTRETTEWLARADLFPVSASEWALLDDLAGGRLSRDSAYLLRAPCIPGYGAAWFRRADGDKVWARSYTGSHNLDEVEHVLAFDLPSGLSAAERLRGMRLMCRLILVGQTVTFQSAEEIRAVLNARPMWISARIIVPEAVASGPVRDSVCALAREKGWDIGPEPWTLSRVADVVREWCWWLEE